MAAGLEAGAVTSKTAFFCPGYFRLGRYRYDDWKEEGHGRQDLMEGIAHSCNVYFYQAALKTGINPIARVAREFGLVKVDITRVGNPGHPTIPIISPNG